MNLRQYINDNSFYDPFDKNDEFYDSKVFYILCEDINEFHRAQKLLFDNDYNWIDDDLNIFNPADKLPFKYLSITVYVKFSHFTYKKYYGLPSRIKKEWLKDLENMFFIDDLFQIDL